PSRWLHAESAPLSPGRGSVASSLNIDKSSGIKLECWFRRVHLEVDLGFWVVETGVELQWGRTGVERTVFLGLKDEAIVNVGINSTESERSSFRNAGVGGNLVGGDSTSIHDEVAGCGEGNFGAFDDLAGTNVEVA